MGIGIEARGTLTTTFDTLVDAFAALEVWPQSLLRLQHRTATTAYFCAHPAAPDCELSLEGETVLFFAQTTTVGPGYHAFIADALKRVSEHCTWNDVRDDADFFASGNRVHLEATFLGWLRNTLRTILAKAEDGFVGFAISLPADTRFLFPAFLLTPLGPRDRTWIANAIENDEVAREHFLWWNERDATFYLRTALTRMWCDLAFRPALDDKEETGVRTTLAELEQAFALDSGQDFPWIEWTELFALIGEESLRATRTQLRALESAKSANLNDAAIGYRRADVERDIGGGFRLKVPGALAFRWEREGTTLVLWDRDRSLWVTTMTHDGQPDAVFAELGASSLDEHTPAQEYGFDKELGPDFVLKGGVRLRTEESTDDSENALRGEAWAVVPGHAALATFVSQNPQDNEWLLDTWASLMR